MNNEPVAWMGKDYDGLKTELYFDVERNKLPYRLYESAIPLYTHPVKDLANALTDKEITKLWCEVFNFPNYDCLTELDFKFCREIIRKAQEK